MEKWQLGCGNDIVKVSRIEDAILKSDETFIKRVYTDKEKNYCESKKNSKYQSYAARFAAKEALFKAMSNEDMCETSWQDIEVTNIETGKPQIHLYGKLKEYAKSIGIEEEKMDISLSHEQEYAIATVVIEY